MRNDRRRTSAGRALLIGLVIGLSVTSALPGAPAAARQTGSATPPAVPGAAALPDGAWVVATAALTLDQGTYVWEAARHATLPQDAAPVAVDDGLLVALDQPVTVRGDAAAGRPVAPFSGLAVSGDDPILPVAAASDGAAADRAPFLLVGLPAEADAPEREPFDESPAPDEPFAIAAGDYVLAVVSAAERDVDALLASVPLRVRVGDAFVVSADDLALDAPLPRTDEERQAWADLAAGTVPPGPDATPTNDGSAADGTDPVWVIALVPSADHRAVVSRRGTTAIPANPSARSSSTAASTSSSPSASSSASSSASMSASASVSPSASVMASSSPVASATGSDSGSISVTRPGGPITDLLDLDEDGLTLAEERDLDTNPTVADSDGDGLLDGNEIGPGCSPLVQDTDADGLNDALEVALYRTSCRQADTDTDGLTDYDELFRLPLSSDPLLFDTDADGLSDGDEYGYGADPRDQDSDGDGLSDGLDVVLGLRPDVVDTDGDCIGDGTEHLVTGTHPIALDTDGDGYSDFIEVTGGSDPLDSTDFANYPGEAMPRCDPNAPKM